MKREDMLDHVRPFVEDLAGELADILWGRLEVQLDQALDAARSALASELDPSDVDEAAPAPDRRSEPRFQTGRSAGLKPVTELDRDRSNMLRRDADAEVALRLPRTRRAATCRICGAVGFTAKGCGRTHNVTTEPAAIVAAPRAARAPAPAPSIISPPAPILMVAVDDDDEEPPVADAPEDEDVELELDAPPPGPRDRFATIQAAAKARQSTGTLPVPRSTFRT